VRTARREGQRAAGRDSQKPPLGVEQIEEREEIALVRAAPVEQHEEPRRLGGSRTYEMIKRV
jgi:hypothetical protein